MRNENFCKDCVHRYVPPNEKLAVGWECRHPRMARTDWLTGQVSYPRCGALRLGPLCSDYEETKRPVSRVAL